MKSLFVPVKDLRPIKKLLPETTKLMKGFKSVSITSTVQFNHRVKEVSDYLTSKGFKTIKYDSVLGCKAITPKNDCTLIISNGEFHAINIGLVTGKPVFILDPVSGKASKLDESIIKNYQKKQAIRVSKALYADVIGILVSTKPGQNKLALAHSIKQLLESKGKYEVILFLGDELSPGQLNDYPVDAWINTGCPRLIEDDFEKPIVNWDEIKSYF